MEGGGRGRRAVFCFYSCCNQRPAIRAPSHVGYDVTRATPFRSVFGEGTRLAAPTSCVPKPLLCLSTSVKQSIKLHACTHPFSAALVCGSSFRCTVLKLILPSINSNPEGLGCCSAPKSKATVRNGSSRRSAGTDGCRCAVTLTDGANGLYQWLPLLLWIALSVRGSLLSVSDVHKPQLTPVHRNDFEINQ